jgi:hypothetical protein
MKLDSNPALATRRSAVDDWSEVQSLGTTVSKSLTGTAAVERPPGEYRITQS